MCVFFLYFVTLFFFYSGNLSTYFTSLVIIRDVWWFKFLSGIRSRQSERKGFGFLKEELNTVVIHP